jgi:acyl carrier protein
VVTLLFGTAPTGTVTSTRSAVTWEEQSRSTRRSARLEAQTGASQADARVPERLRKLFVEQLMLKESQVTYDARFVEDLGFDSLKTVECVLTFEEEFKIEVPDEDAEKFLRVRDVIEYLRKRKLID